MAGKVVFRSQAPRMPARRRSYGIPGEVPSLPITPSLNPWTYTTPTVDLGAMDSRMAAEEQAAPQRRLESLDKLKSVSSMALASPDVAAEVGDVADGLGFPATGAAIGKMRRTMPGAPAIPGGPSLPQDDGLAEALAATIGQAAESAPFDDKLVNQAHQGLMKARLDAHNKQLELRAQYGVEMDPQLGKPAVERAVRGEKRLQDRADIPVDVEKAQRVGVAQQDAQTEGAYQRAQDVEDIQQERAMPRRLFEKQQESDIDVETYGDKKELDALAEPAIAGEKERRVQGERTRAETVREGNKAAIDTGKLKQQLALRLQDFEKRLTRTTEELKTRQTQKAAGKPAKSSKLTEEAIKEAIQFVSKLEDKDLKELGTDRKTYTAEVVSAYLGAVEDATMDPTARALKQRFAR